MVDARETKWYKEMPSELAIFVYNATHDDNAEPTLNLAVREAAYVLGLFAEAGTSQNDALTGSDADDVAWAKKQVADTKLWVKRYGKGVTPAAAVEPATAPVGDAPIMAINRHAPAPATAVAVLGNDGDAGGVVVIAEHASGATEPTLNVSEFGGQILKAIAVLELETEDENVPATKLAEYLKESPQKVAGCFTALLKIDAITKGGEKGAGTVKLTPLGWESVNNQNDFCNRGPIADAEAANATMVPVACEAPADWASTAQQLTADQITALKLIAHGMVAISDIFMADALREVDEAQPLWLNLVPSNTAGAYYDAALAPMGVTELMDSYPEIFAVSEAQPANSAEAAPKAAKGTAAKKEPKKRGPKNGVPVSAAGERKVAQAAKTPRPRVAREKVAKTGGKGGRPARGNKSLRELVLAQLQQHLQHGQQGTTTKELAPFIAGLLKTDVTAVQNAIWKLAKSAFLNVDENGRAAQPLALTMKGATGYATNHGKNLKESILGALKTDATDAAIALQLGCDIAWVHDLRIGRVYQAKKKAEQPAPLFEAAPEVAAPEPKAAVKRKAPAAKKAKAKKAPAALGKSAKGEATTAVAEPVAHKISEMLLIEQH